MRARVEKGYVLVWTKYTTVCSDDNAFSWDTCGIPFVVDNFATAIIRNEGRLFTGQFNPNTITLETAEGVSTKTKLVGSIRLVFTGFGNEHHV